MDKKEFQALRIRMGLLQRELAEYLGKGLKTVQHYESGWRAVPPDVARLMRIFSDNPRFKNKYPPERKPA